MRVAAEREFEFDVEAPTERVGALLCDPRRLDDLTPEWFSRVVDRLVYEIPMGQWLDRLLVASELRRIFAHRAEAVRRELVPIQP